ncbi:alpha/beta-hydrolase [Daedalea quercina L-15889]|uniref:Alpha/beta-hydrolase n=1 Tax=Daedalea quercina L-15889 TaxID=1314783 RepID=A0A165TPK3_9APHY|nr:alpha/beta-hydrolase [Daedalea quercina L-15889]
MSVSTALALAHDITYLTFTYKEVDNTCLLLDVYLPGHHGQLRPAQRSHISCPVVVYFHGGGLTVGNKRSWFPRWLHRRMTRAGCAFISVEYRLIPPSTGHDVLADVKDAMHFISHKLNSLLLHNHDSDDAEATLPAFTVDSGRVAVVGTSSGGLCAFFAAIHATPRPKAVLSMYGMGGNMLTPHYFMPKKEIFFRGRELLEPVRFSEYLYPASQQLSTTADSPLAYHPSGSPTPGYPANPRMQLARLYFQLGVYLDYYTGYHEPSLSAAIREAYGHSSDLEPESGNSRVDQLRSLVPAESLHLFPQFCVSEPMSESLRWPATLLVHGTADTAICADESRNLYTLLRHAGVDVALRLVQGQEHSFDYVKNAEEIFGGEGGLFGEAAAFLIRHLEA